MQVHGPREIYDASKIRPCLNGEFVVMAIGHVELFIYTPEECDALIKAAVEAKRLLAPPVIIDSDRTCDQANPVTGAWCHRGGDHGVHRDTDGEEWRTDLRVTDDEPRGYLRCEDTSPAGGFTCTLKLKHEGLHSQLTPTGAFMAEWGYADGHVHTTSGHQPASVTA